MSTKGPLALRTISETADALGVQQHVLRFWETKFTFIRPTKRAGGRRFYRPQDVQLLEAVKTLLYDRGYTIRGVQMLFKENGQKSIMNALQGGDAPPEVEAAVTGVIPEAVDGANRPDYADLAVLQKMSEDTRQKFLDVARTIEEAQAVLGRALERTQSGRSY